MQITTLLCIKQKCKWFLQVGKKNKWSKEYLNRAYQKVSDAPPSHTHKHLRWVEDKAKHKNPLSFSTTIRLFSHFPQTTTFFSSHFYSALIPKRIRERIKAKREMCLHLEPCHMSKDESLLEKWPTCRLLPRPSLLQYTCAVCRRASGYGTMSLPVSSSSGVGLGKEDQPSAIMCSLCSLSILGKGTQE